ncbi:MAG: hypothetical protein Unbinned6284contig1001_30 [Prokaryotic dsDNA virus sp.]|nr:MAG: hypothetical protein Unbinned6284contig1001_30 [Prokaryotic dsDNA virus sp.]
MEIIELDQEFFDSVKNDKRKDVVNGIVNNVMSGQYEYKCVGEHWNLQDFVNDTLGDKSACELIADAVTDLNQITSAAAIFRVSILARKKLKPIVEAFCNQHDVGIA